MPSLAENVKTVYDTVQKYTPTMFRRNSIRIAKSTRILPGGSGYTGEWSAGKLCGIGRKITPQGEMYEGHFFDSKFEGIGRYIYKDGTIYAGEFSKGLKHGKGKLESKDGSSYEGTWINDF